jgi:hypothetical protein
MLATCRTNPAIVVGELLDRMPQRFDFCPRSVHCDQYVRHRNSISYAGWLGDAGFGRMSERFAYWASVNQVADFFNRR